MDRKSIKRLILWLSGLALLLIIVFSSITIIPTGYTGVRTTFGQIDSQTIANGLSLKIPFLQGIIKVNNKQQDIVFSDMIWSETSERTAIYFEGVTVTYQISAEKSAWIVAHVTDYKNSLVSASLVASAIKMSSKTLPASDATNRAIIEPLAQENVQRSLDEKYGEGVVYVNKVVINNIDFDDVYNAAIAEKQNAQLIYEKQQIENRQAIEKAEADAKVKLTEAQAKADALLIEAQAEAEANRVLADSLSELILKKMYYDKWDGQLPDVVGSASIIEASPFIE